MSTPTSTEAQAIATLARLSATPMSASPADDGCAIPFVVVPQDHSVANLEHLFPAPARKRGTFTMRDAESFVRMVKAQASNEETTRLYGTQNPPQFVAVFNDHGAEPGWRDHKATYACPLSVEWQTWIGQNKKSMTQEQFAQFIEDNAPDCVSPDAATMIEIARTLEAKKKVNFASGIRLSNGQNELTYEESIEGTAGKGRFTIPETFQIGIAVLEGGPRYAVTARLRYRIGDKGALTMWFDLDRPHKVMEDAFIETKTFIQTETGMPVFNGS